MPVLCEEPSLYPEDLLDRAPGDCPDVRWWVLHTRARQEKAVARHLLRHGVGFYVPQVRKSLTYGRRRVVSRVPLFAGYVFMFGSAEARTTSLASHRLSGVLPVDDAQRLWTDLRRVRGLIASNAPLTLESRLAGGQRVRLRHGPLAGLEGTVVRRHGQTRVVVSVDFIQQGASVEVEDGCLELVE